MALGRRRREMIEEGYMDHLGLQVGYVGMQVCGFPRWSKRERERERSNGKHCHISNMAGPIPC
jgi:hypothetical protein